MERNHTRTPQARQGMETENAWRVRLHLERMTRNAALFVKWDKLVGYAVATDAPAPLTAFRIGYRKGVALNVVNAQARAIAFASIHPGG